VIAPSAIVTVMYVWVGGVEMACVGGGSAKFRKRVDASRHVTLWPRSNLMHVSQGWGGCAGLRN